MISLHKIITTKALRFVLLTIVLGAVGSGAWEWMLKPFLLGASEFGLNVATLGIQSFKDSLYEDIARGLHEESSLRLYSAVFGIFPLFMLGVVTGAMQARRTIKSGISNTAQERIINWLAKPLFVVLIFVVVFSVVQANQLAYVNRAITHAQQLLMIVDPYISQDQQLLFRSRFAQVSSSEEYAQLTAEIERICHARSLRVPEFSVW